MLVQSIRCPPQKRPSLLADLAAQTTSPEAAGPHFSEGPVEFTRFKLRLDKKRQRLKTKCTHVDSRSFLPGPPLSQHHPPAPSAEFKANVTSPTSAQVPKPPRKSRAPQPLSPETHATVHISPAKSPAQLPLHFPHSHPYIRLWSDVNLLTDFPGCFQRRTTRRLKSLRCAARFASTAAVNDMEAWYTPLDTHRRHWPRPGDVEGERQSCGDGAGPAGVRVTRQQREEGHLRARAAPLLDAVTQKLHFLPCSQQAASGSLSADTGDAADALNMLAAAHLGEGLPISLHCRIDSSGTAFYYRMPGTLASALHSPAASYHALVLKRCCTLVHAG